MLKGGESIEQPVFFFIKKLYVKDVKINEVLKTKEEKYVGLSHPASKSLHLILKNSIWTSTTLRFQKSILLNIYLHKLCKNELVTYKFIYI